MQDGEAEIEVDDVSTEPQEGDVIIGADDLTAYCDGAEIVRVSNIEADEYDCPREATYAAIAAWMTRHDYYPDVWVISDHGNACDVTAEIMPMTTTPRD
jgi:hypothetical protein